jgi:acyl-coenzyme A synthetase/AMP-(fatty) acid ligase
MFALRGDKVLYGLVKQGLIKGEIGIAIVRLPLEERSAEVERVILGLEGVHLVHVLGVPAREGHEEEVVALVVMQDGETPSTSDLQRLCAEALPKYMQPCAIWRVEDLPLTSTGKVDRAAARRIALGLALPDLPTRPVPEIKS